jgi:plasmid stabilization system protein ParE
LDAPDLFVEELEAAHSLLLEQPHTGSIFRAVGEVPIRRMLLRRTRQWLYYSVDEAQQLIIVHTVWGAERGSTPKLGA